MIRLYALEYPTKTERVLIRTFDLENDVTNDEYYNKNDSKEFILNDLSEAYNIPAENIWLKMNNELPPYRN